MQEYIATFFSHFGALRFQKLCADKGWHAEVRPVPRSLSSSCGTCVFFSTAHLGAVEDLATPELEQVVAVQNHAYLILWQASD